MSQKRPDEVPGLLYHITSRGNDGLPIVLDDIDRTERLRLVATTVVRYEWKCRAYALLDNHEHLLIELTQPNRALGMAFLNAKYARRFNRRHGRSDHLFGKPYGCRPVVSRKHFERVTTYIPVNAYDAGLCERPERYVWCSYAATVGLAPMPTFLEPGPLLEQFGRDAARARARYMAAVEQAMEVWPERPRSSRWDGAVDWWDES